MPSDRWQNVWQKVQPGISPALVADRVPTQRYRKGGGTPGTVYFAYDEAGHLVGEYHSSISFTQETVWLGDIPIAMLRANAGGGVDVFNVHTDQLNTPRKVTNTLNQLRWKWDPTPFGEGSPVENPASLGTFKYNLRFPGQYFDLETNLNYNYFRDYDAATGRYVQSDPIGLRGGPSTFTYANGRPSMASDSRGLFGLSHRETWSEVSYLPSTKEGKVVIGLTRGIIEDVRCKCVGSGNCWKLEECTAVLHIEVKILDGMLGPKDRFSRASEQQHVDDLMAGIDLIYEWGELEEERLKKKTCASKVTCERSAAEKMKSTLQKAANEIAQDSGERYDERGRHTWHDHYFSHPPY